MTRIRESLEFIGLLLLLNKLIMQVSVEIGAIVPEFVKGGLLRGDLATKEVCISIVATIFRKSR